jgi:pimeloyl-ACP methyl ester carboxylesterase
VSLDLPELRYVELDGPVAFRSWDGPDDVTFVMVHGLGASHLSWVQVAPALSGLGRVLALDLPGFGRSPRAGRPGGLMDLRRTLGRFVDEVAGGPVVLCGSSLGGGIAVLQAAIDPASVSRLVLSGTTFPIARGRLPHPVVTAAFGLYAWPRVGEAVIEQRLRRLSAERIVALGFLVTTADPRTIPRDVVRLHEELVRDRQRDPETVSAFLEATRSMIRLIRRPEVARRALDNVRCPVLLLHGRRDRLVPVAYAEAELARHPTWRARIFPDLGHVPMMEAPGRWLAAIADWLALPVP